jgi:hypothetical protein
MDGHYPNTSHFKRSKLFTDISIRQARKVSNELSKGLMACNWSLWKIFRTPTPAVPMKVGPTTCDHKCISTLLTWVSNLRIVIPRVVQHVPYLSLPVR